MRKPNDQNVKDVIGNFLDKYRLRQKFEETSIIAMWPDLMGTAIAKRTTQIYVYDKKLFVRLESSVIKNELLMVRQDILNRLNEKAGSKIISDIIFL